MRASKPPSGRHRGFEALAPGGSGTSTNGLDRLDHPNRGSGALRLGLVALRGLDVRMRHELGVPVHVATDPLRSVALGAGRCVEEFTALQRVLVASEYR